MSTTPSKPDTARWASAADDLSWRAMAAADELNPYPVTTAKGSAERKEDEHLASDVRTYAETVSTWALDVARDAHELLVKAATIELDHERNEDRQSRELGELASLAAKLGHTLRGSLR